MNRIVKIAFGSVLLLGLQMAPQRCQAEDAAPSHSVGIRVSDSPLPKDGPGGKVYKSKLKVMSKDELDKLLSKRLSGGLGEEFGPFANMFMVQSMMELGVGIGLTASQAGTEKIRLEPAFPRTYQPTFKEFLDAIALETGTTWIYDAGDQFASSDKPQAKELTGMAVIMFTPHVSKLPYQLTPADGWQAKACPNWIMYVPPTAPVGMDLHILGRLSAADKSKEAELFAQAPADAALELLQRVNKAATKADLIKSQVGSYPAIGFDTWLPAGGKEYHWRQWYFMVGDQLCYVISTLKNDQDQKLFPDVEKMLKTFH